MTKKIVLYDRKHGVILDEIAVPKEDMQSVNLLIGMLKKNNICDRHGDLVVCDKYETVVDDEFGESMIEFI
jgi:hypothetical protein